MEQVYKTTTALNETHIESACASLGFQLGMKGSVKTLPQNIHWHYKTPRQTGVLEITLLLTENKLIFNCKKSRMADWIIPATNSLKLALKLNEIKL